MSEKNTDSTIAIMLETLPGGGMERSCLKLIIGIQKRGFRADLVLRSLEGELLSLVPKEINIVSFAKSRMLTTLFPLISYLRKQKPAVLITNFYPVSIVAVMAKILARRGNTRLIIVERCHLSNQKSYDSFRRKVFLFFMRWLYPKADAIVGVSNGVSRSIEQCLGLKKESVKTIYNGVIDEGFFERANEPVEHKWFQPEKPPVFLAVGRLVDQKDFSTLLRAFALLRKKRPAKLIILGEGYLRESLENLVEELGLKEDVDMPGFEINPLRYYRKCSTFVMSSRYEGLPGVIIEALARGCSIVATNCPSGSAEILDNGKYGELVPVGDFHAMAEAMEKALDFPPDPASLVERAKQFNIEKAVSNYLSII
jgi:glycosyltransferase involved in cell wall biosynthesis